MNDPKDMAELAERTNRNTKFVGLGLETATIMACGFCGAPDWLETLIVDTRASLEAGAVCSACGRGMRAEFTDYPGGNYTCEFVQTCGDDAPAFLPPIRRAIAQ